MMDSLLTTIPLIAPAVLLVFSIIAVWNKNSKRLSKFAEYLAWIGIASAIASGIILYMSGTLQSGLLGFKGLGFAIRIDSLSMIMFNMIAILGRVVIRYSVN